MTTLAHLKHITLRGTAEAIQQNRAPLRTALEQAPWPDTEKIIILRRVQVRGNVREIAAQTAAQAQRMAALAVDGWSPAAEHAQAVSFANHSSLTSCLIRDVLQGQATQRWYWASRASLLQRSPSEVLSELLQQAPLQLPEILLRLSKTSVWINFWQQMHAYQTTQIISHIAVATGWSSSIQNALAQLREPAPSNDHNPILLRPILPYSRSIAYPASDVRVLLLAILELWQQAPALFNTHLGSAQLLALVQQLATPDPNKRATNPSNTREHNRFANPTTPPVHDASVLATTPNSIQLPNLPKQVTQHSEANIALPWVPAETGYLIQQAGLFYLLNFLNQPAIQAQLPLHIPAAGWRCLYDLACALDCPPEGILLEIFAELCGFEHGWQLAQQDTIAPLATLLKLGLKRYGEQLWQANTWRISARLIYDRSHLELHFRLQDAQIDIRKVGLDINPGWLPWLGRVVRFYYDSEQ